MTTVLWNFPVAATALIGSPRFLALPKRQCEIFIKFEGADGANATTTFLFEGVEAYKCTYLPFCTLEMIGTAYGKLVRLETSSWLVDFHRMSTDGRRSPKALQHLMIYFDDGPCYEFICCGVRIS